jgi:hypothetical protein
MANDREQMYQKYTSFCNEYECEPLAQIYMKTLGKNTLVRSIFRIVHDVNTPPTRKTEDGCCEWDYRELIIRLVNKTDGKSYIYLYTKVYDEIFRFTNIKIYNKQGKRVYYYKPNDYHIDLETEEEIIKFALDVNIDPLRKFIFDELVAQPRLSLLENIKTCRYPVSVTGTKITNYDDIPTDFIIKYGENKEIRVHKFALGCISNYFKKLIYGSGSIEGVDVIDLSMFNDNTIEWFAKFIYKPRVFLIDMTDDDWALFDYIDIDIDALLGQACVELGLL